MRVWDVPPSILCRKHLLGEHRECHAIFVILSQGKKGYRHHPETKRWEGKLAALYARHEKLVKEMEKRGYVHASPLNKKHAKGKKMQDTFVDTPAKQLKLLKEKPCDCPLD
ncbi:MAG: pyrimidine dimer DNA glycosylase/endonuclease V [archaeon]